jgi:hypothetical protein
MGLYGGDSNTLSMRSRVLVSAICGSNAVRFAARRQWTGDFTSGSRSLTFLFGNSCLSRKLALSAFTNTQYSAVAIPWISTT